MSSMTEYNAHINVWHPLWACLQEERMSLLKTGQPIQEGQLCFNLHPLNLPRQQQQQQQQQHQVKKGS